MSSNLPNLPNFDSISRDQFNELRVKFKAGKEQSLEVLWSLMNSIQYPPILKEFGLQVVNILRVADDAASRDKVPLYIERIAEILFEHSEEAYSELASVDTVDEFEIRLRDLSLGLLAGAGFVPLQSWPQFSEEILLLSMQIRLKGFIANLLKQRGESATDLANALLKAEDQKIITLIKAINDELYRITLGRGASGLEQAVLDEVMTNKSLSSKFIKDLVTEVENFFLTVVGELVDLTNEDTAKITISNLLDLLKEHTHGEQTEHGFATLEFPRLESLT